MSRRACLAIASALLLTNACAHRYRVDGIVLAVDRAHETMTVSHRPIEGYMPAMAMPFRAAQARELNGLTPGARVSFQLSKGRAASIKRVDAGLDDIPIPKPLNQVAPGGAIPDFALIDQSGQSVRLSNFRGRPVVIDFIYTRCPLPDVCPRLSANFATLQRRLPDIALLSVTLDPGYDRPPILAAYARQYAADPNRWHFLTGTLEEVRTVAGYFGLVFWEEENMIAHTAATAVVARDGTLAALVEGSSHRWEQLRDLIQAVDR